MIMFFVILIGLVIGSYLHVVLDRLPSMLELVPFPHHRSKNGFNLAWPRSHCPECQTTLRFYDLIPLLSYIQLRGRCRYCKKSFSWTYPVVELFTAILFALVYWQWGITLIAAAIAISLCTLFVLAVLDYRYHMLPDCITLPLLWLGLLVNLQGLIVPLPDAVIGAMIGYTSLWLIFWVHKWITGKNGLGYGDFKLLAALGAWLGWAALPLLVVIASSLGLVFAVVHYYRKQLSRTTALPLGTFLAIAGGYLILFY